MPNDMPEESSKGARELPDALKREIEEDALYFIYQGGTFAHVRYLDEYGEWEPEISQYAAKILNERNETW